MKPLLQVFLFRKEMSSQESEQMQCGDFFFKSRYKAYCSICEAILR